jgi:TIR domain
MLKVFISYSHKDKDLLDELNAQMATLRHLDLIEQWTDKEIAAGAEWEAEIWTHFNSADIVILLISADFLNSYYCYRKEFESAEQRHHRKEVTLLPVIVRACDWRDGRLDRLQCLCTDKPVYTYGEKPMDRDPAWTTVVTEIRKVVTQKASAGKPKARASQEDEEDSEGDLVPFLCNRQEQEQQLFEKYFDAAANAPGAPQIYFLPGREDAVHASFITRVQCGIVPRLLGEDFESLRHLTQLIGAEWVQQTTHGEGTSLPHSQTGLADRLQTKGGRGADQAAPQGGRQYHHHSSPPLREVLERKGARPSARIYRFLEQGGRQ